MLTGTAVYGTVRTVVWEDGGGDPASYPIMQKETMKTAKEIYNTLEKGILDIVKAADIYTLHLLATLRGAPAPPYDTIKSIVNGGVSVVSLVTWPYSEEERELLRKDGHLKAIGQQIIVSAYTAIELYLVHKFAEYYKYSLREVPSEFVEASLDKIYMRSLKDISGNFFDFFKIHLPSFDIDFYSTEGSNFRPHTAWDALLLLSKTRNEILHLGECSYPVITLVDCWYPFEFTRYYVELFEVNFDDYIYRGKEYRLVREHNQRITKKPGNAGNRQKAK